MTHMQEQTLIPPILPSYFVSEMMNQGGCCPQGDCCPPRPSGTVSCYYGVTIRSFFITLLTLAFLLVLLLKPAQLLTFRDVMGPGSQINNFQIWALNLATR